MNGYHFTVHVRQVLSDCREESARLQHEYVGTEHILLALIRAKESVAFAVLRNLSIDPDELRKRLETTVKKGTVKSDDLAVLELPYTSRAKKVLELAMAEARDLGHNYVGTEHLLLGLIREERGIAAQVLVYEGATLDAARAEVRRHPDVTARSPSASVEPMRTPLSSPTLSRYAKALAFWLLILLIPIVLIQLSGK